MRREGNTIVLESTPCTCTFRNDGTKGLVPGRKTCPDCKGTRRGPRGGRNRCACFDGTVPDFTNLVPCRQCNGTGAVPEDTLSFMPKAIWQELTFKVYRHNGGLTWNESWLGLGCVYSAYDYGRATAQSDDEIIAAVRENATAIQLSKVAREVGDRIELCNHVAILVGQNGYSVRASFDPDGADVVRARNAEPSEAADRIIGAAVAAAGGHGVLAAAGR